MAKKYVSLSKLSTFLDNLKNTFAAIGHKHTLSDISDYKVDTELSSTSTSPVQNKVVNAEFDAISDAMGALELAVDGKADAEHNHNDVYYTMEQVDTAIANSGAVLYTEQTLTDEQKTQARKNLGTDYYDWHKLNTNSNAYYSTWAADYFMDGSGSYPFWNEAMALPSPDDEQFSALYMFLSAVAYMFHKGADDFRIGRAASNGKALLDAGLMPTSQTAVIVAEGCIQKNTAVNCAVFNFWYRPASGDFRVVATNASTTRILRFSPDGTLLFDRLADNDKSLSIAGMPADAKAVGDALALKADLEHTHDDTYYTEAEIDAMEFITIDDIDAICV